MRESRLRWSVALVLPKRGVWVLRRERFHPRRSPRWVHPPEGCNGARVVRCRTGAVLRPKHRSVTTGVSQRRGVSTGIGIFDFLESDGMHHGRLYGIQRLSAAAKKRWRSDRSRGRMENEWFGFDERRRASFPGATPNPETLGRYEEGRHRLVPSGSGSSPLPHFRQHPIHTLTSGEPRRRHFRQESREGRSNI